MLTLTAHQRIGAVLRQQLRSGDFKVGESAEVPLEMRLRNPNLVNLLEMPVSPPSEPSTTRAWR